KLTKVVKRDKMPCFDDKASLLYLDAILREVLRWYPHVPLGIPHVGSNNDVYNGYFIPKQLICSSIRALSRDEDMFPDASCFNPSRHLTVDGKLKDPFVNHMAFGRQMFLAGRWFAENVLWTAAATILAVLRIDHAKDSNGDRIEVKPEFTTGLAM
ncbi:cytochrome P450, partial [Suillus discolor]